MTGRASGVTLPCVQRTTTTATAGRSCGLGRPVGAERGVGQMFDGGSDLGVHEAVGGLKAQGAQDGDARGGGPGGRR